MEHLSQTLFVQEIAYERDVVMARQRARQVAALLAYDSKDQTRVATAVSEVARNAFMYAGGGRTEFTVETDDSGQWFTVRVSDRGPGIADVQQVLDGNHASAAGSGRGLIGAKRLIDRFHIHSTPTGTVVTLSKALPRAYRKKELAPIAATLLRQRPQDPFEEIQQQNRELLRTLEELRQRQHELAQLNRELEETNRGVVALYAELDEKAFTLQRANEVKSRFLSNMTHEFRTPLNSILSLSRLLLDHVDGELNGEQRRQIEYIRRSADTLYELVNDLLDLAKVEAGKVRVRADEFKMDALIGTLRGMLKPLLAANTSVNLVFDEPVALPVLNTDEGKVAQILRNLISNALKYTERGEVRVSVHTLPENRIEFAVADTGIGIAAEDQGRIFEEFTQIDSTLQRKVKGTGLGLPLSRKLAQLLGGTIRLESELGKGSTFYLSVPAVYEGPTEANYVPPLPDQLEPGRKPILVVEDNPEALFVYDKYVKHAGFQVMPARTLAEARAVLRKLKPAAVILDILLDGESGWEFLTELKSDPATRAIPVLVVTLVDNEAKALALGADAFHIKPVGRAWLLRQLAGSANGRNRVLVIDDDEISRYLVQGALSDTEFEVMEAINGNEGLRLAHERLPGAIILDLAMPDLSGYDVLNRLKHDPGTKDIPVLVYTACVLSPEERTRLNAASAIIPKQSGSRERTQQALCETLRHTLQPFSL